jgi:hypothetical protein
MYYSYAENPESYLDEIADAYFKQTKIILHPSTIWRKLMKQGYRLKIYSERAKQQNEADQAAYMKALHLLVRNPNQVLLIDAANIVMSCCRCLCFRSSSLCPPLSKELHVGTIIHNVPTASTYNTKVRFPNCIVQRVFTFFANNNILVLTPCGVN